MPRYRLVKIFSLHATIYPIFLIIMALLHPHPAILEFISPPLLILMLVAVWAASLTGLHRAPYKKSSKVILALLFVVIPPAAVVWMGMELYQKHEVLAGNVEKSGYSSR